ncbi:hypothetical protein NUACC21_62390 [Scytonema sp. NUACC21]
MRPSAARYKLTTPVRSTYALKKILFLSTYYSSFILVRGFSGTWKKVKRLISNPPNTKTMNFSFGKQTSKTSTQQTRQVKEWIYQAFQLNEEIPISLSQLSCTEPGCPPIETVIAVMTNPIQQYKIHKPIAEIEYADIAQLLQK